MNLLESHILGVFASIFDFGDDFEGVGAVVGVVAEVHFEVLIGEAVDDDELEGLVEERTVGFLGNGVVKVDLAVVNLEEESENLIEEGVEDGVVFLHSIK